MQVSIKAAALALVLAFTVPATVTPVHAGEGKSAEELAREGLEQMLKAFEQLLHSIPQYGPPKILDNGDIVIPRIRPGERQGGDDPDKKAKPATPPKLEETRA